MKRLSLVSVLLPALVVPFIMTYRLSPGDTPYWLFALIFLLLILFIGVDLLSLIKDVYFKVKEILLWIILTLVIGSAFYSVISVRHTVAPIYTVHDIILQQEAAIRFLLDGINPYTTTYFGTPLEDWHYSDTETNPALYHFVMQPFYLLFALPFYFISHNTIGYFDARIPLYFLFFATLVLLRFLIQDKEKRILALTLFALNPAMLSYTQEGRSDMFMFAFLFAGFYFLFKERFSSGGISIALACAVKQSAWFVLPLYIAYLYFKTNTRKTIQYFIPFLITFAIIVGPFLIWDYKAFLDSTVFYLSGSGQNSYPISGYGLGMLLHEVGFIQNLKSYYPFIIWQIIISIPLLVILIHFLKKNLQVRTVILLYGIFLFVFWYLSRYFNNSHLAYLTVVFITSYFWPEEKS